MGRVRSFVSFSSGAPYFRPTFSRSTAPRRPPLRPRKKGAPKGERDNEFLVIQFQLDIRLPLFLPRETFCRYAEKQNFLSMASRHFIFLCELHKHYLLYWRCSTSSIS